MQSSRLHFSIPCFFSSPGCKGRSRQFHSCRYSSNSTCHPSSCILRRNGKNVPPFCTALPQPQGFSVEVNFSGIDVIFKILQTSSKAGYQNIFWDLNQLNFIVLVLCYWVFSVTLRKAIRLIRVINHSRKYQNIP